MLAKRLLQLSKLFSTQRLEAPKKYSESLNRSRNIMNLYDLDVRYDGYVFVAPNATIVGDVWMGSDIAVWHGTVIRGDMNNITYFLAKLVWEKTLVSVTIVFFTHPLLHLPASAQD